LYFFLWWGFNILTAFKPVSKIEGTIEEKTSQTITVKIEDGESITIPVKDFSIGEQVSISFYKQRITGKKQYRYAKIVSMVVSDD
jgi:hypothetical protein